MPVGWRNYKINAKRNNVRLYQHNITELFNVPMPVRKHARNDIKNWRDQGVNALPYLATIAVSHFTDEFKWYSEQWRITPQARGALKPVNPEAYTLICPKGEGYTDWYLWNIDKMIDAIDSNGLYFDFGQPSVYLCTNTLHGCGWQDNHGVMRPSLRIRATRDMQKRIYQMERRLMQHIIDFELKLPNGETIVREYQRALLQAANICGFIVRVSTKGIELQETGIEQTYSQSMILENEIITKSVIVSRIKDDESANLLEEHLNTLVRYKDKLNENKYINTIAERCKTV
jgi:hypothetical protein